MDWIDELKPGRETDGQLAVSVFGWRTDGKLIYPPENDQRNKWAAKFDEFGCPSYLPKWSTDLVKAFEAHDVSLKVIDGNHNFSVTYIPGAGGNPDWLWSVWIMIGSGEGIGYAADIPMAIARASLRACKAVKRG